MSARIVHVAVGVIVASDKKILIAKRADKAHQGGLWEFPGGKVEPGENLHQALERELYEELAIKVIATQPLIKIRHDYGDKVVLLDVHKVTRFSGEPQGNEGQPIAWVAPEKLSDYDFPAANRPIITAINLPQRMLITGELNSTEDFFARTQKALRKGIRLVQLRVADDAAIPELLDRMLVLCRQFSAQLQVNASPDLFAVIEQPEIGLHLTTRNLLLCDQRPVGENILLSASCHNDIEISHAQKIGVDFICLSPVHATSTHPDGLPMGWSVFESLVEYTSIPVFALGGMKESDLPRAIAAGAQGIAGISEWWEPGSR